MGRDRGQFGEDFIDHVDVYLSTGTDVLSGSDDAGTDGEVYLLLGGREFNIKRADINDRLPGATDVYRLGSGATIQNPIQNNPRGMPISLFWDNPIGVRFQPEQGKPGDTWQCEDVYLSIHTDGGFEDVATTPAILNNTWLGWQFGFTLQGLILEVMDEDKSPLKNKRPEPA